jgi:hypothetical protein
VVDVHLVEMNLALGVGQVEEFAANVAEFDGGVGKFPFAVFLGLDGGAECAAEDLVPETDACEADVGAVRPYVCDVSLSALVALNAPISAPFLTRTVIYGY